MKTCIKLENLEFPVTVEQATSGKFRVTYGEQVRDNLNYTQAAHEFGECVFHALACADKLDNSKA